MCHHGTTLLHAELRFFVEHGPQTLPQPGEGAGDLRDGGVVPAAGQIPRGAVVVPFRIAGSEELAVSRLRVPLHHRAEAAHGRGPQVQLPIRDFPGEAADIKAPEQHAGKPGAETRAELAPQLLPRAQLISGPVNGHGLGARVSGPAERHALHAVFLHPAVIGLHILHGIAVVGLAARRAIRQTDIAAKQEFAAVGLESFHAHFQQGPTLVKPPAAGFRVGEIRQKTPGEPFVRDHIGRTVRMPHHIPSGDGFLPVPAGGLHVRTVVQRFQHGNLPQYQMQPLIPDAPHRPRRVGPDGIPAVEGAFIAPRFQHHDGGRAIVLFQHGELLIHVRVAVPAVGADPQPEGPLRRQHAFSRQGQIGPKLGGGGSRQQMIRDSRPCGGLDANGSPLFKGKADVLSRVPEPAEAAVRQEHGHGQIAPRALLRKVLHHLTAAAPALLIGAVKALAGAVHMALTAPQRRFHPGGRSVRPQKEGDFRAGKRPQRPERVSAKAQGAFRLPGRASQGQRRAAFLPFGAQIYAGNQLGPA